jgi:Fungal specific transcription factor domain
MDLFDMGSYFSSLVPIKALTHPLLKHAACACAAKQLGLVKGLKSRSSGLRVQALRQSELGNGDIDWLYSGAKHYDEAIGLLRSKLQRGVHDSGTMNSNMISSTDSGLESNVDAGWDEVLAATAILCVYEFLSATGPAWNGHLSGTKSLLDDAHGHMLSVEEDQWSSISQFTFSRAQRAIFWNFARQDYLSGRECFVP